MPQISFIPSEILFPLKSFFSAYAPYSSLFLCASFRFNEYAHFSYRFARFNFKVLFDFFWISLEQYHSIYIFTSVLLIIFFFFSFAYCSLSSVLPT